MIQPHSTQSSQLLFPQGAPHDVNPHNVQPTQNTNQGNNAPSSMTSNISTDRRQSGFAQFHNSSPTTTGGPLHPSQIPFNTYSQSSIPTTGPPNDGHPVDLPPIRPVFGVTLEDLLKRDGSAIPLVVYQCLQAVDLFGLEVEGIYRLSGSAAHVTKLRTLFDNGNLILYFFKALC